MTGETPEQRQQKLDEARKRVQQAQQYFHGRWSGVVPDPTPTDFGAAVSGQLAKQREIGGGKGADMRVPSFEEREAERARMADHFRKNGVL